ncbi:MAG: PSD1 and planctomycete cytochrome C domain-containing protein [Rhodothermaceae bacterium]|nr:PSD1 and planctomycete cytochrome C domain-containing protein [Rhodothermaceae bacterium]
MPRLSQPQIGLCILSLLIVISGCADQHALPEDIAFNKHIRPILSDNCFKCHGPDEEAIEGDLRLDLEVEAKKEREGYQVIAEGKPGRSEMIRRIKLDPDNEDYMPHEDANKSLDEYEIALLEKWITDGAEWEDHWAYIAPQKRTPPSSRATRSYEHPIDRFVVATLQENKQKLSPRADSVTLLRRLYFDMIGLPPGYDEVRSFLDDPDPQAYESVVQDLLASPHFGEKMAIGWLDIVRYADTNGFHSDVHRHIYPYRDYVINAFNANMPFDRFTKEQLAGDLLPEPTLDQRIASGFNRLNQITKEGGAQDKEYRLKYAADRVRAFSATWMGATVGCAECHDHKFDPYTAKDFYSLSAFFADIDEKGIYRNSPYVPPEMPVPSPELADSVAQLDTFLVTIHKQLQDSVSLSAQEIARMREQLDVHRALRDTLVKDMPATLVTVPVAPRDVRVLPRGNWMDESGEIVQPDLPHFLPASQGNNAKRLNRLDLSDWLFEEENPLTGRVFVNRLWKQFFNEGLSRVLDDLGSQGEPPVHPELLDWLAVEFRESGWDVKHLVELIVTSETYKQSSTPRPELEEVDPANTLLARQESYRLEAELIRDNALAVSGLLSRRIGGRSVQPYQPEGYWANINTFGVKGPGTTWTAEEDEEQYRRGVYTYWKRTFLHPSMLAFDAPTRQESEAKRSESNTPSQALVLLNDPTYVEAARVFAQRIMDEGGESVESRMQWAYREALSRDARPEELQLLTQLYSANKTEFAEDESLALQFVSTGNAPLAGSASKAELAAWTSISRTIFNLHEMIMRY